VSACAVTTPFDCRRPFSDARSNPPVIVVAAVLETSMALAVNSPTVTPVTVAAQLPPAAMPLLIVPLPSSTSDASDTAPALQVTALAAALADPDCTTV